MEDFVNAEVNSVVVPCDFHGTTTLNSEAGTYCDGRCTVILSPTSMLIRSSPTSSGPE